MALDGSGLLTTKLFAPPIRSGWVRRERLARLLVDANAVPLILVSAGAGFGKTSLVTEWLAASGVRGAWVSLDEGDNDPARFWTYVCAALGRALPDLLGTLQEPEVARRDPQSLVATIVNGLAHYDGRVVLVLDDLHVIDSERVHDSLVFLLRNCPQQLGLVVTTRTDPPWPLSRLRANGRVCEIRSADLRFTLEEAAQLLRVAADERLDDEACGALQRRTEGWVVGLHMAALSLRGSPDVGRFIEGFSGSHRFVLDYLAEEVLALQDAETRDFMLRTSILRAFTGTLCDAVLVRQRSAETIEQLEARNLFLVPLDANREWYRYHHLFQQYLRSRLSSEGVDPRELHSRASAWFEEQGLREEAIDHAIDAEEHPRAIALLERAVETRFTVQRQVRTLGWLKRLPQNLVSARPKLSSVNIWAAFVIGHWEEAELRLQQAQAALPTADLSPAEREDAETQYLIYSAWIAYKSGKEELCIEQATAALARLGPAPSPRHALTLLALARGQLYAGNLQDARRSCERILTLEIPELDPINIQVALSMAALASLLHGELRQVIADYERAMSALGNDQGPPNLAAGLIRLCMGEALREQGNLERAESLLREGVEQVQRQLGLPEHVCKGLLALARVRLQRGARDDAERLLAQADEIARSVAKRGSDYARLLAPAYAYRARLWLELGNVSALTQWLAEPGVAQTASTWAGWELLPVRVALLQNDIDRAQALLHATAPESPRAQVEHAWLRIVAQYQRGEVDAALDAAYKLAPRAAAWGYHAVFTEPPRIQALLDAVVGQRSPDPAPVLGGGDSSNERKSNAHADTSSPIDAHLAPMSPPDAADSSSELTEELNERELAILRLMSAGLSNAEMASELYLSVHTVKWHARNLYAKLGVNSRSRALARGRQFKLV